jgi:hypothetical protein
VESLVLALDQSANQARRTMRVVSLHNANSAVVQQTLGSLMTKVRASAPRTVRTSATGNGPAYGTAAPTAQTPAPAADSSDVDPTAQFFQQQMMRRMFQGGGGIGGQGGGGFGGPGGGRGGRGGGGGGRGGNNGPGR